MRVAYICTDPGVPVFGSKGCSIHVQEVIRSMLDVGVAVTMFAQRLGGEPSPDLRGVEVLQLPKLIATGGQAREQEVLAANDVLLEMLHQNGPFDLVYERYALWGWGGMAYARAKGIPGLLEVNAPLIQEQARHRELVDREGAEAVAHRVFHEAQDVIAVSEAVAEYVVGYGVPRAHLHVIPNGVNPERFCPDLMPFTGRDHRFTAGFVGTLKPWHGLAVLIDAFGAFQKRCPGAELLIVGDGPERERLARHVDRLGLENRVHFTGKVPPEDVPAWLARMDVGVVPYPRMDNCYFSPLKVFEYMAAGVPVVASRIGQVAEVIEDGFTGLLVPPGDEVRLAQALYEMWKDEQQSIRIGRAARRYVIAHHTWDQVVCTLLEIAHEGAQILKTEGVRV